jgi:large repetitive protein
MTPLSRLEKAIAILVLLATFATLSPGQTYTTIYEFAAYDVPSVLVQGLDGNFYGTTGVGGSFDDGTIFKVTPSGALTTIYNFTGGSDGAGPYSGAGLTLGSDGNFYGSTYAGGSGQSGTIFKVTPSGTLTTLHTFSGSDGAYLMTALVLGSDGNFYGTTAAGGANGGGTIFKITPTGTLTTLYAFYLAGGRYFTYPSPLVQGTDGNFYGTTQCCGVSINYGDGIAFKMTPSGTLTVLYAFCSLSNCSDGSQPLAGLAQDNNGNFYGTTWEGGANDNGTVFQITPGGNLTTLHSFNASVDGWGPSVALIQATDSNLYGTTPNGGSNGGQGTIFEITPGGTLTTLYTYCSGCTTYANSYTPTELTQGTDGTFYGSTAGDGTSTTATIFNLSTGLSPFVKTVPVAGPVGIPVFITGSGLNGTSSVTFNGLSASFTVDSDTEITATVPAGATTGPVSVVTPTGTLQSNVNFQVVLQSTSVAVIATPTPSLDGQSVTMTATVTPAFSGTPTGTVTFYDGGSVLASEPLLVNGQFTQAVYSTAQLQPGPQNLTAVYSGDSNYQGSSSAVYAQQVLIPTSTAVSSNQNPSLVGQNVTFTATVSPTFAGTPTGTVTFYSGTTLLGSAPLVINGAVYQAAYSTAQLPVGTQTITAIYGGDSNFGRSSSPGYSQQVVLSTTTTGLVAEPNPSNAGQLVTLTATVTSSSGGTPTGTVTFYDNGAALGSTTLEANGQANQAVYSSTLSVGMQQITAVYSGDSNFMGSTSPAVNEQVFGGGIGLVSGSPNFGSLNLNTSSTGTLTFNIGSNVNLAVAVLTLGAPGQDFAIVNGSNNCAGSQTAPTACTVTVSFTPSAPGLRMGAIQLTDQNSGNVFTSLLQGVGVGPTVSFGPPVQNTISAPAGNGFAFVVGMAVDGLGNIFEIDGNDGLVFETVGGWNGTTTAIPNLSLSRPQAVAVDGAGDLYVANAGVGQVFTLPYLGTPGSYGPQQTLNFPQFNDPYGAGVAVDGAGDVFVTDWSNTQILELPSLGNGTYGQYVTAVASTSLNGNPQGVAIDSNGNLYVADNYPEVLQFQPAQGGGWSASGNPISPGSYPFLDPGQLAINASALFVSDPFQGFGQVVEIPLPLGSAAPIQITDVFESDGLAVDAIGDVFIGGSETAIEVQALQNVENPIQLSFTPSSASPTPQYTSTSAQALTLQNIGNQPLNATSKGLVISRNFVDQGPSSTGSTLPDCVKSFKATPALAPGAACDLGLAFSPQTVGNINGTVIFNDNATNSPQTVTLSGVSTSLVASVSLSSSVGSVAPGGTFKLTATVTAQNGAPVTFGKVYFYVGPTGSTSDTSLGSASLSTQGRASLSSVPTTNLSPGQNTIWAFYQNEGAPGWCGVVLEATATTTVTSSTGGSSYIGQSVTFTATINPAIPDGETVTFYVDGAAQKPPATTSSSQATFTTSTLSAATTKLPSHTIKAVYAGDSNFETSTGSVSQTVSLYSTTTTLSASPNPSAYGQSVTLTASVTTTGTSAPTGTVTFSNGTTSLGKGTVGSNGTATLKTTSLPVGSNSLTASYSGDKNNASSSTASSLPQTVNPATVTVSITSGTNPAAQGQSITFTVTLKSNGSLPVGQSVTVVCADCGESIIGGGQIGMNGTAQVTGVIPAGPGYYHIQGLYYGTQDYNGSGVLAYGTTMENIGSLKIKVTTIAATLGAPGSSSVTLNGTINPEGDAGQYQFAWSTLSGTLGSIVSYSCTFTNCPAWTANKNAQAFSYQITGLTSGTTYYFRIVADDTTANVSWSGEILSFTAP